MCALVFLETGQTAKESIVIAAMDRNIGRSLVRPVKRHEKYCVRVAH
jgi:hypothetical protein